LADNQDMTFKSCEKLFEFFEDNGVITVLVKQLSENDNSKQQIYLGGSFEALNQIPSGEITVDDTARTPNMKAPLEFYWVNDSGTISRAPYAQLILYPNYPEVRLSGFLRGCHTAPSAHMRPVSASERTGAFDGRLLFLGVTGDQKIIAYLSLPGTPISVSIDDNGILEGKKEGVFFRVSLVDKRDDRSKILSALSEIARQGWQIGKRLNRKGEVIEYSSPNAGGYTLEAMLNIIPNGIPEPDKYGWEIKAFSGKPITLMTPEPDQGEYVDKGFTNFVSRFGHITTDRKIYFVGIHRYGIEHKRTGLTIVTPGFNMEKGIITDIGNGICLVTPTGEIVAKWSYAKLIEHWRKKHNRAVYIPFRTRFNQANKKEYCFSESVEIGSGTDFTLFLKAFCEKSIYYDPASWIRYEGEKPPQQKRRNQFRISSNNLSALYYRFEKITV